MVFYFIDNNKKYKYDFDTIYVREFMIMSNHRRDLFNRLNKIWVQIERMTEKTNKLLK